MNGEDKGVSAPGPASKPEYLTISLTGRPPVRVDKAQWPVVAGAKRWDNQYEAQANRTWRLTVRQHDDGRAVVYGVYTTQFQGANDRRAGELVDPDGDIPAAIQRVGEYLEFEQDIIDECIHDLPAIDL